PFFRFLLTRPHIPPLFPYTTLFRSRRHDGYRRLLPGRNIRRALSCNLRRSRAMALHLAIRVDSRDPIGTRSAVFAGISDLGGKEGQRDLEKDQRQGIVPAGITQDDAVGHANDGVQLRLAVWCTSAHAPDYSGPGVRSEARASAGGANSEPCVHGSGTGVARGP